ncbi:NADH-quinone oxidoreductase subunit L [Buchnera aphidicola (Chaitoregma tattakana)]|uniref:NADH-quinone oxidoreductase subunit L n=1 Tax=Buchnera aphidicola TaxID=9 RepID=UPI0031B81762
MSIILGTFLFPILGFFLSIFLKKIFNKKILFFIGFFSLLASFLSSLFSLYFFYKLKKHFFLFNLWNLMSVDKFKFNISFLLDELSLYMLIMITGIGIIIYSFSYWYMYLEEEVTKFFSYINLFISSMSILVLSDNFLLLYFGWESVGICSYLLVSFYNKNCKNVFYSIKSFLISKISDIFFLISILLIYYCFKTFNIIEISKILNLNNGYQNLFFIKLVCIFLLLSAISKSAQFPFHTWLPYAMVGPTTASALIHSATMVTSGVYLISRARDIFIFDNEFFFIISLVGSASIVLGSILAIFNKDIKKILAYSTISQIGYMFLSIGAKAWNEAILYLISHAIFKSLIFISTCCIIANNKNNQNIFKISMSKEDNILAYFSFLIGSLSLMSFPVITLGFYSKGEILFKIFESKNYLFLYIAIIGSIFTTIYTLRLFLNVLSLNKGSISKNLHENFFHDIPLLVLMFFSTFLGFFAIPNLSHFFCQINKKNNFYNYLEVLSSIVTIVTFIFYFLSKKNKLFTKKNFILEKIYTFIIPMFKKDFYINSFYTFLEYLYVFLSKILYKDISKKFISISIFFIKFFNKLFLEFHCGSLKRYIIIFFVVLVFTTTLIMFI